MNRNQIRSYNLRSQNKTKRPLIATLNNNESSQWNPDINSIFKKLNKRFFWGRLTGIKLELSKRLKRCAGVCVYRPKKNFCCIRLSSPLLSLRPHSDLIDTLLHEMIHAYLFLTKTRDYGSHGPEFHKHMNRINQKAATNITVYHTFHSEVKFYKQHWWRCNGPCQQRAPFYGMVKRSRNKAPGPSDSWWQHHVLTCGGQYMKIREPIEYTQRRGKGLFSIDKSQNGDSNCFKVPLQKYGLENITGFVDLTLPSRNLRSISGYVDLTSLPETSPDPSQPCPICSINIFGDLSSHVSRCLQNSGLVNILNETESPVVTYSPCNILNNRDLNHVNREIPTHTPQSLCPVCDREVKGNIKTHLEGGCLSSSGIFEDCEKPLCRPENVCPVCGEVKSNIKTHLEEGCLYSSGILDEIEKETCHSKNLCPICGIDIETDIQTHLESRCLTDSGILDDLNLPFQDEDCEITGCTSATMTKTTRTVSSDLNTQGSNAKCEQITCPICSMEVMSDLNDHVNECINNSGLFDDSD